MSRMPASRIRGLKAGTACCDRAQSAIEIASTREGALAATNFISQGASFGR